jgi:hypothetical protein
VALHCDLRCELSENLLLILITPASWRPDSLHFVNVSLLFTFYKCFSSLYIMFSLKTKNGFAFYVKTVEAEAIAEAMKTVYLKTLI